MPKVYQRTLSFDGDAFRIFEHFKDQRQVFFLDSSLQRKQGRFSYIGFSPFKTIRGGDLNTLRKAFSRYRMPQGKLTFPAGAVGYLGYDGSIYFGFYDTIICLDHQEKKSTVSGFSKSCIKNICKVLADCRGLSSREVAVRSATLALRHPPAQIEFESNFSKREYIKTIHQVLKHIRRGDIYQINLSHQMKAVLPHWRKRVHPAEIYRHLRNQFPSEFGAYLDDGKQVILSASPERFLQLNNGKVQVKPMKGTRPRGKSRAADKRMKQELLKSPKEIAELLMVTDLERNDLGRVCDYASVKATKLRTIETYASVFQATSTVEGMLQKSFDQFDLLKATFPSGSVTGCPKIEAMKIIAKLEHGSRGLYTGALGYISFTGDMDFNVMIRTLFLKQNQFSFHIGGGIVADSKPEAEWQETLDKAKPLLAAIKASLS